MIRSGRDIIDRLIDRCRLIFKFPASSTTRLRRAVLLKVSCRCRDKRILSQRRNAPQEPFFCDFPARREGLRGGGCAAILPLPSSRDQRTLFYTRLRARCLFMVSCHCRGKGILSQRRNAPQEPFFCDFPARGEGFFFFRNVAITGRPRGVAPTRRSVDSQRQAANGHPLRNVIDDERASG